MQQGFSFFFFCFQMFSCSD